MTDRSVEIYGTFGPTCHTCSDLKQMLEMGMNAIRLNLSHSSLMDHEDWIQNLDKACRQSHKDCALVIDLQGRERRLGVFEAFEVKTGQRIFAPEMLPVSLDLLERLECGKSLLIGDENLPLLVVEKKDGKVLLEAQAAGLLEPRKAIHLADLPMDFPVCSNEDLENLKAGARLHVRGVLVPFVQSPSDLKQVRNIVDRWIPGCRILAKIENMNGVRNLKSIIPEADLIVIARGDLGASCSLEWLPAVQDYMEQVCHEMNAPYLVVTQMLESMRSHPIPTRPEVRDVYQAVLHGASAVMLTGETASSLYPLEAMDWLCRLVRAACYVRKNPDTLQKLIETL